MNEVKTEVYDNLGELYWKEFTEPTNVVIRRDSTFWKEKRPGPIFFDNIVSMRFEIPGEVFSTSEDGKYLFKKEPEDGNLWLIRYIGDDESLVLPEGLYGIGKRAFEGKKNLRSVCLPEGLKVIGEGAFSSCENLEEVNFPKGLMKILEYAFHGTGLREIELPSSLYAIESSAFSLCGKLEKVTFGENSELKVLDSSFMDCGNLREFVFPDHLQMVDSFCFADCPCLEELYLPETVTDLTPGVFYDVRDLYLKTIPNGVISSLVNRRGSSRSYSFSIHYNDSLLTFPRSMDEAKEHNAEDLIWNVKKNACIPAYAYATDKAQEELSAFEMFTRYHIPAVKKHLMDGYNSSCLVTQYFEKKQEEQIIELLNLYKDEDMLNNEMIDTARNYALKYSWPGLSAYIMELTEEVGRQKISFEL